MKIDRIELYLVENPFYKPWRTAYGADNGNSAVFTRLVSGEHEGWSESSPLPGPNYSYEYGHGAFEVVRRFLAPALIGREFSSARELNAAMDHVKGNPFAKAAPEMAWWTLEADCRGKTLGQLLGATATEIELGDGWGVCDTYDELIRNIGISVDQGHRRVKLKLMRGWDVDMLTAVRSVFPKLMLHVDCNASFTPADTDLLLKLDKFDLAMIEQPFACTDIYSHAKLQKQLDTPLCLDEAVTEPWHAEQAAELGACRYINIKPARVGGLQNTLDINRICEQAGIGCWIGGMLESDIGKGICTEVAGISNMVYPHDITPASVTYPTAMTDTPLVDVNCRLKLSSRVGTPVPPNIDRVRELAVETAVFTA